jgi:HTH-type transcriptional regulator/antitoxin HipB
VNRTIIFYTTVDGKCPVQDFLDELPGKVAQKVVLVLRLLDYEQFKIGVVLRQARESAGLTQEELALRLKTQKTAISRIENHAEDIKLSTLDRVAKALGKRLEVNIA